MSHRVEFLLIIEHDSILCNSVVSLNNLIMANDQIQVNASKITFKGISYDFEIQYGETINDANKYYHIRITNSYSDDLDKFEELLKVVRTIFHKVTNRAPQIIWDDVSKYYSEISYPTIYEIENLMRKLITKFMLTNVGIGWTKETIPKEVAESVRNKEDTSTQNYLYEVDFIQLAKILFKEYTLVNLKPIYENIKSSQDITQINFNDLKLLIPKSNWERYFKPIVECEADFLRTRWERLYELRNKVAHNKFITKNDSLEINRIVNEIKPIILNAIDSLDKIEVSEEEKETVAENAASGVNKIFSQFITIWQELHHAMFELAVLCSNETENEKVNLLKNNIRGLLNYLCKKKQVISLTLREQIADQFKFRNIIVHNSDVIFPEETVSKRILEVLNCYNEILYVIQNYIEETATNINKKIDDVTDELIDCD